jgi:hypothetical protein
LIVGPSNAFAAQPVERGYVGRRQWHTSSRIWRNTTKCTRWQFRASVAFHVLVLTLCSRLALDSRRRKAPGAPRPPLPSPPQHLKGTAAVQAISTTKRKRPRLRRSLARRPKRRTTTRPRRRTKRRPAWRRALTRLHPRWQPRLLLLRRRRPKRHLRPKRRRRPTQAK